MRIWKDVSFEAAHRLPNVPEGHKCARLHGHSFKVRLELDGPDLPGFAWVQDYADVREAWRPVENELDHHYLNEIPGLENPTTEVIARWIWNRLWLKLPLLVAVEVQETATSGCRYEGER